MAERAGVSIATVSHALNRPDRVGAATRERVLDVVDELGFTPKVSAVALARRGVGRIGVLAPFTSYPSYSTRLMGVLEASALRSVDVVVFDVPSVAVAPSPLLRTLPVTARRPADHGRAARGRDGPAPGQAQARHCAGRQLP